MPDPAPAPQPIQNKLKDAVRQRASQILFEPNEDGTYPDEADAIDQAAGEIGSGAQTANAQGETPLPLPPVAQAKQTTAANGVPETVAPKEEGSGGPVKNPDATPATDDAQAYFEARRAVIGALGTNEPVANAYKAQSINLLARLYNLNPVDVLDQWDSLAQGITGSPKATPKDVWKTTADVFDANMKITGAQSDLAAWATKMATGAKLTPEEQAGYEATLQKYQDGVKQASGQGEFLRPFFQWLAQGFSAVATSAATTDWGGGDSSQAMFTALTGSPNAPAAQQALIDSHRKQEEAIAPNIAAMKSLGDQQAQNFKNTPLSQIPAQMVEGIAGVAPSAGYVVAHAGAGAALGAGAGAMMADPIAGLAPGAMIGVGKANFNLVAGQTFADLMTNPDTAGKIDPALAARSSLATGLVVAAAQTFMESKLPGVSEALEAGIRRSIGQTITDGTLRSALLKGATKAVGATVNVTAQQVVMTSAQILNDAIVRNLTNAGKSPDDPSRVPGLTNQEVVQKLGDSLNGAMSFLPFVAVTALAGKAYAAGMRRFGKPLEGSTPAGETLGGIAPDQAAATVKTQADMTSQPAQRPFQPPFIDENNPAHQVPSMHMAVDQGVIPELKNGVELSSDREAALSASQTRGDAGIPAQPLLSALESKYPKPIVDQFRQDLSDGAKGPVDPAVQAFEEKTPGFNYDALREVALYVDGGTGEPRGIRPADVDRTLTGLGLDNLLPQREVHTFQLDPNQTKVVRNAQEADLAQGEGYKAAAWKVGDSWYGKVYDSAAARKVDQTTEPARGTEATPQKQADADLAARASSLPKGDPEANLARAQAESLAKTGKPLGDNAWKAELLKNKNITPEQADGALTIMKSMAEATGQKWDDYQRRHVLQTVEGLTGKRKDGTTFEPKGIYRPADGVHLAQILIHGGKGDVSTAIHEFAHSLAYELKAGNSPHLEAFEDHFGRRFEDWSREDHESFARLVEQYVHDGHLPKNATPALSRALYWVSKWMRKVYQGIKNKLNERMSPEIKQALDGVFSGNQDRSVYGPGQKLTLMDRLEGDAIRNREYFQEEEDRPEPRVRWQQAFHGSKKRRLDVLDSNHLLTGYGANTKGAGLYLSEDVARAGQFRKGAEPVIKLGGKEWEPGGELKQLIREYGGTREGAKIYERYAEKFADRPAARPDQALEAAAAARKGDLAVEQGGQVYSAAIPHSSELMDWDKPLLRQPEAVKAKLKAMGFDKPSDLDKTGEQMYRRVSKLIRERNFDPAGIRATPDEKASALFASQGIPGHQYADPISAQMGGDHKSFVIYDDQAIKKTGELFQDDEQKFDAANPGADKEQSPIDAEKGGEWWMYKDLKEQRPVAIVGKKVAFTRDASGVMTNKSADSLAKVLKIYRNRKYETFRFVLVRDGQIVDHLAVTSENPSRTGIAPASFPDSASYLDHVKGLAEKMDASVVLVHNHPSGEVEPSMNDFAVTKRASDTFGDRYAGHIILDYGKVALLGKGPEDGAARWTKDRDYAIHDLTGKKTPDKTVNEGPAPVWAGMKVTGPQDLLALAGHVNDDRADLPVFMTNASGRLTAMRYLPVADFEDPAARETYYRDRLLEIQKNTGTTMAFPYAEDAKRLALAEDLHSAALVADYLDLTSGQAKAKGQYGGSVVIDMPNDEIKRNTRELFQDEEDPSTLPKATAMSKSKPYKNQRQFKDDLQNAVRAQEEAAGYSFDVLAKDAEIGDLRKQLSKLDENDKSPKAVAMRADLEGRLAQSNTDFTKAMGRLHGLAVGDALEALKTNSNAVGWYDDRVAKCLNILGEVLPQIKTDPEARNAFLWSLATLSNGMKVDRNFKMAVDVFHQWEANGRKFPDSFRGEGTAADAQRKTLKLYNELSSKLGNEELFRALMTPMKAKEAELLFGKEVSGEAKDETVLGSSVLGSKIGNGFFANLNKVFTQLTMDRWLIRSWGRWTGTLIEHRPEMVAAKTKELTGVLEEASRDQKIAEKVASLLKMDPKDITPENADEVSLKVKRLSVQASWRDQLNGVKSGGKEIGTDIRLLANALEKYKDGQKESPDGPRERQLIRQVFNQSLDSLKEKGYNNLTMADYQAILWYAEKRLYDGMREESSDAGYADDEAPDYANAAADLARTKGVPDERIKQILAGADGPGGAGPGSHGGRSPLAAHQGGVLEPPRQYSDPELQRSLRAAVIRNLRLDRGNAQEPSGPFRRGSAETTKRLRGLGDVESTWTPEKSFSNSAELAGIKKHDFAELKASPEGAQKFHDLISQAKASTGDAGAQVYVYDPADYQGMKLFVRDDGGAGFAIKGNDLVSVFSKGADNGATVQMLQLAVQMGARKLDCFDTFLPGVYARHGFTAIARTPWNEGLAPDGWSKKYFEDHNGGQPDVVFMALTHDHFGQYDPSQGQRFDGEDAYSKAQAAQEEYLGTRNPELYQPDEEETRTALESPNPEERKYVPDQILSSFSGKSWADEELGRRALAAPLADLSRDFPTKEAFAEHLNSDQATKYTPEEIDALWRQGHALAGEPADKWFQAWIKTAGAVKDWLKTVREGRGDREIPAKVLELEKAGAPEDQIARILARDPAINRQLFWESDYVLNRDASPWGPSLEAQAMLDSLKDDEAPATGESRAEVPLHDMSPETAKKVASGKVSVAGLTKKVGKLQDKVAALKDALKDAQAEAKVGDSAAGKYLKEVLGDARKEAAAGVKVAKDQGHEDVLQAKAAGRDALESARQEARMAQEQAVERARAAGKERLESYAERAQAYQEALVIAEKEAHALTKTRHKMLDIARRLTRPLGDKIDSQYADAIDEIRNLVDPAFRGQKTLDRLANLRALLRQDPEAKKIFAPDTLNKIQGRNLSELSLADLTKLAATRKLLEQEGRAVYKKRYEAAIMKPVWDFKRRIIAQLSGFAGPASAAGMSADDKSYAMSQSGFRELMDTFDLAIKYRVPDSFVRAMKAEGINDGQLVNALKKYGEDGEKKKLNGNQLEILKRQKQAAFAAFNPDRARGSEEEIKANRDKNIARALGLEFITPDRVLDSLDGPGKMGEHGPIWEMIYGLTNGERGFAPEMAHDRMHTMEGMAKVLKDNGLSAKTLAEKLEFNGVTMTKDAVLELWAGEKAPQKLAALLGGNNLRPAMIRGLVDQLTPQEKAVGQYILDTYSRHFDELRTKGELLTGKRVIASDGAYSPMHRAEVSGTDITSKMDGAAAAGAVSRTGPEEGMLKERLDLPLSKQAPLKLGLVDNFLRSFDSELRLIHGGVPLKIMDKVWNDPTVKKLVQERFGSDVFKYVNDLISREARPDVFRADNSGAMDKIMGLIGQNMSTMALGLNIASAVIQPAAVFHYLPYFSNPVAGMGRIAQAAYDIIRSGGKTLEAIDAKDPLFTARDVDPMIEDIRKAKMAGTMGIRKQVEAVMFAPIQAMDRVTAGAGWLAVYRNALAHGMTEEQAIAQARYATLQTQPSHSNMDTSKFFKDQNSWKRMFSRFLGPSNKVTNMIAHDIGRASGSGTFASKVKVVGSIMAGLALMEFSMFVLRNKRPPEDANEWESLPGDFLTSGIPVIGNVIGNVLDAIFHTNLAGTPRTAPINQLQQDIVQMTKNHKDEYSKDKAFGQGLLDLAGVTTGVVPANQIMKTEKAFHLASQGHPGDLMWLLLGGSKDSPKDAQP